MNIVTIVNGIKTAVSKIPFINLVSGSFVAKLSTDTLTANRDQKLPDKDGTIALVGDVQPLSAILTSFDSIPQSSRGLIEKSSNLAVVSIPATALGKSILAASNPESGRNLLGVGNLGIKQSSGLWLNNSYFTSNVNTSSGGITGGVDPIVDRLLGATLKYSVTTTPTIDASPIFDSSGDTSANFSVIDPQIIEVDFTNDGGLGSFAFVFLTGFMAFSFVDYHPSKYYTPLSIKVEYLQRNSSNPVGVWIDAAIANPLDNTSTFHNEPLIVELPTLPYVAKLKLTFTSRSADSFMAITACRYFASRPESTELTQFILTASTNPQYIYSQSLELSSSALDTKSIKLGPGTIQLNGQAIQCESLMGSKIVTNPNATDTIIVVGAEIGDIVKTSRGLGAFVIAPNTIQFDSTGLNSVNVLAIVERFV